MTILLRAYNMVEIPDLVQNSAIVITAEIWNSANLGVKGIRDLGEGICCCIGGKNSCRSEHIVSRIHLEDLCDCLIEVHDFLVILVSRFVAGNVKCGCTSSVL